MSNISWLDTDEGKAYGPVWSRIAEIRQRQSSIYRAFRHYWNVYSLRSLNNIEKTGEVVESVINFDAITKPKLNAVRSCVDTALSMFVASDPGIRMLTRAGEQSLQAQAKKLELLINGVFDDTDYDNEVYLQVKDGLIFGTGFLKWAIDPIEERIVAEHIPIWNIVVDNQTPCLNWTPELFEVTKASLGALIALYPDHEDKLKRMEGDTTTLVDVAEAYYLPVGEQAGRHVICTKGVDLVDEEWTEPDFPYDVYRWNDDQVGFYGIGMVEEVSGCQCEVDELSGKIKSNLDIFAVPYLLNPEASQIPDEWLETNRAFQVVPYSGKQKPEIVIPNAVPTQVFQEREFQFQKVFDQSGVSALSAMSKKPAGLNAAVALREYLDNESRRFGPPLRRFHKLYAKAAYRIIALAEELEGFNVSVATDEFLDEINFKDVKMSKEQFRIEPKTVNMLAFSFSARMEQVTELVKGGFMSKDAGQRALNMPDIDNFFQLENAPVNYFHQLYEEMLETGKYVTPVDFLPQQESVRIGVMYWAKAMNEGVDSKKVKVLEKHLRAAQKLASQQMPKPAPTPVAPPVGPFAPPQIAPPPGPRPPGPPSGPAAGPIPNRPPITPRPIQGPPLNKGPNS